MATIFDLRHIQASNSFRISLCVLSNPKNMGIAVAVSLLACIEA